MKKTKKLVKKRVQKERIIKKRFTRKKEVALFIFLAVLGILFLISLLVNNNFPQANAILDVGEDVAAWRDLSDFSGSEINFDVVVEVLVRDNATAIGINESVPIGWVVNPDSCVGCSCTFSGNILEILIFDSSNGVISQNISYTILPNSVSGTFSGTWDSVNPDLSGVVKGDTFAATSGDMDGDSYAGGVGLDCADVVADCLNANVVWDIGTKTRYTSPYYYCVGNLSLINPSRVDSSCNGVDDNCNVLIDDNVATTTDPDGDRVRTSCDLCAGSDSSLIPSRGVNYRGCVMPTYSEFNEDVSTHFWDYGNLRTLNTILKLGVPGKGFISFNGSSGLNVEAADFDSYVEIKENSIMVNVTGLSFLTNKSAIIHFYNVDFNDPKILADGFECNLTTVPMCNQTGNYLGTVVYNVSHFTTYTLYDADPTPTPTPPSPGGPSGPGPSGPSPSCVSNWSCGDWSICGDNGKKTRKCVDLKKCSSVNITESEDCYCEEYWSCEDWIVDGNRKIRDCVDINACGTTKNKPDVYMDIEVTKNSSMKIYLILLVAILVGGVVGLIFYFIKTGVFSKGASSGPSVIVNKPTSSVSDYISGLMKKSGSLANPKSNVVANKPVVSSVKPNLVNKPVSTVNKPAPLSKPSVSPISKSGIATKIVSSSNKQPVSANKPF